MQFFQRYFADKKGKIKYILTIPSIFDAVIIGIYAAGMCGIQKSAVRTLNFPTAQDRIFQNIYC